MSGTITTPDGRQDEVWLSKATQRNNRRKTRRQIAELQRRLAVETLTAEQRSRIESEIAELEERFR
ncbi:MAG: hypothetical protein AAFY34_09255 [Pseudomonadota bacterium]